MADERAEPLTGAEIAALRERWLFVAGREPADVWRLLATLEAVRPLVVAMAGYEWQVYPDGWDNVGVSCPWCGTTPEPYDHRANERLQHDADCPVTQARALKERLGW